MNDGGEVLMMKNISLVTMRKSIVALLLAIIALVPQVSASTVAKPTEFDVTYLYPLLLSLFIAAILWKFFVPRQLSALQVAFEIDDNLYEVHRLTRTTEDARDILQQGRVAFGVGLAWASRDGPRPPALGTNGPNAFLVASGQ